MSILRVGRRPWVRSVAAALAVLGLFTVVMPSAEAHPGPPLSQFDPDRVSWRFVYNRTSAQFAADFNDAVADGYMVIDLEIHKNADFSVSSPYRVAAVFQKNLDGRRWRSRRDMTHTEFLVERQQAFDENLRLHDMDVYRTSSTGGNLYAAAWVENIPDLKRGFAFDIKLQDMEEYVANVRHMQRTVLDIQEYTKPGCEVCFAVASASNNTTGLDWQVHWGLTDAQFAARFSQYRDHYRMLAVHSVYHMGTQLTGQRYAGIWVENRNGRGWMERRDMDATEFAAVYAQATSDGYRPITFDAYWNEETNRPEFAMVWRQND